METSHTAGEGQHLAGEGHQGLTKLISYYEFV